MANLSNINNKFLVTTGGNILIGQTAAVGSSILQVTGNSTFAGNVTVGTGIIKASIGGDIAITQGAIGLRINDAASAISPTTATSNNDNAVDLGVSNIRFRNLYMGGNGTFAGNVGIGVAAHSTYALDIQGTSGLALRFYNGTTFKSGIAAVTTAGEMIAGSVVDDFAIRANAGNMLFATNGNVERMRIDSAGNVGIGTASPDTKLEVDGKSSYPIIKISASSNTSRAMSLGMTDAVTHFIDAGGSSSNLIFKTVGSERMRIFSNGNVNIGVAEAGASAVTGPFVVTHTSSRFLTSSYEESSVSLSAKNNSNNLETLRLAGDSIKFFNGTNAVGSQKMVILNNGNVGIGTTLPQNDKLHVETDTSTVYDGNSNQTGGLFVNNIYHEALNTFSQIRLGVSGASGASNVRLVGIEPSQAASDFAIVLRNGSVWGEKLRIKGATGHVGIGITSPGTPLQVSGITNNVSTWIGSGWVNNSAYHREGGLLGISGTNATQTSAGIAFQTRNTNNTNYWKSSILMNRGGELEFYLGGAGTGQGTRKLLITSGGRILMPGLDGKTQVHPDVSYRTSDGELFYQTSSERYKTDIVDLENCLDKVNSLRTVRFTDTNTNEPGFGLIAEETNEIIPDVVFSKNEQIEGISYSNLVPFLIKSIQELKAEIELLKSK